MEIKSPLEPKLISFYDITFISGLGMPISIDTAAGDTIDLGETKITIYLAPKPSLSNPKDLSPAQNITLFMAHIAGIQHYSKEIMPPTPEQQFQYSETIKELTSPTIH